MSEASRHDWWGFGLKKSEDMALTEIFIVYKNSERDMVERCPFNDTKRKILEAG